MTRPLYYDLEGKPLGSVLEWAKELERRTGPDAEESWRVGYDERARGCKSCKGTGKRKLTRRTSGETVGGSYKVDEQEGLCPKCRVIVSTVWLGLDHSFSEEGPPLIFETMIFGGPHDEFQRRYSTREEAAEGHARALELAFGDSG